VEGNVTFLDSDATGADEEAAVAEEEEDWFCRSVKPNDEGDSEIASVSRNEMPKKPKK